MWYKGINIRRDALARFRVSVRYRVLAGSSGVFLSRFLCAIFVAQLFGV